MMLLLIMLTPRQAIAQLRQKQSIVQQRQFPYQAEGYQQLLQWLPAQPVTTRILVNLETEEFQQEKLPPLRRREQQALLQHKLQQYFPDRLFRLGLNSRPLQYLSAITDHQRLQPWIEILLKQRFPLQGIYSLPWLSHAILHQPAWPLQLLLSWDGEAGLRQTLFDARQVRLSRLTPATREQLEPVLIQSVHQMYHYLINQSIVSPRQTLVIRLIGQDIASLRPLLPDHEHLQYYTLPAATAPGLHTDADSPADCLPLYFDWIARKTPKTSYATSQQTRFFRWQRGGKYLNTAAAGILLLALISAAALYLQSAQLQQQTQQHQQQYQKLLQHSMHLSRDVTDPAISARDMQQLVQTMQQYQRHNYAPRQVLFPVSQLLQRYPHIALQQISWNNQADPQTLTLHAVLAGFTGQYQQARHYLQQFQHSLAQSPLQPVQLNSPLLQRSVQTIDDQQQQSLLNFNVTLQFNRAAR